MPLHPQHIHPQAHNCLRPTKITAGETWRKTSQKGLLSSPITTTFTTQAQATERSKAFDLLDALSKSGANTLTHCTLHVMVGATQCFDRDLMATLVRDNINPIARSETAELIVAGALFDKSSPDELVTSAYTQP